ncbi:MAG: hypothetical protein Q8P67_17930, partial [archaeon]|nr:hypothetical protein [archaeon]
STLRPLIDDFCHSGDPSSSSSSSFLSSCRSFQRDSERVTTATPASTVGPLSPTAVIGSKPAAFAALQIATSPSEILSIFSGISSERATLDAQELMSLLSRVGRSASQLAPTPHSDQAFSLLLGNLRDALAQPGSDARRAELTMSVHALSECAFYNFRFCRDPNFQSLWHLLFDRLSQDPALDHRSLLLLMQSAAKVSGGLDEVLLSRMQTLAVRVMQKCSEADRSRLLLHLEKLATSSQNEQHRGVLQAIQAEGSLNKTL